MISHTNLSKCPLVYSGPSKRFPAFTVRITLFISGIVSSSMSIRA